MKERACEAPVHHPDCSGIGSTKDHFTPRSVAKLLGWHKNDINSTENIQWLSLACHQEKDFTTPARIKLLKRQRRNENITLEKYLKEIDL